MKTVTKGFYCSLIAYLFCLPYTWTQNLIYSQDFNAGLTPWSVINLGTNDGAWESKANGRADNGTYWNDRDRIATDGNAAVFDGDGFITAGIGNPNVDYKSALRSNSINLSAETKVFLKFNQYFRNFDVKAKVEVSINDGQNWIEVHNNGNVKANVETSNRDVKIIDLSAIVAGEPNVFIRFVFEGKNYFWIIDDVELYDAYPYPLTSPEYFADSLFAFNYPFSVDTSNWAYVPNEIVIQFKPGTLESEKQALRDTLGAIKIDSCVCDILELWQLGDNVLVDGQELTANGGSIGILERVNGSKASSTVDDVDFNRYNYNQLQNVVPSVLNPITALPNGLTNSPSGATKIAILDTGVDYNHPSLINYIWKSSDTSFNDQDDDDSCYEDDPIGWNFIHDNNNPQDDHSHGTHVAGILVDNILNNNTVSCDFRIIPYKTHDEHGISNLFDVTCATYLAMRSGADIINDSWGFYGDASPILSNAFDSAKVNYNTLIIAAAGNDAINVGGQPQYPACFNASNVISVGSYDSLLIDIGVYDFPISSFSNFDQSCVDIVAPGNNILSTVPVSQGTTASKSGTSMAAPAVAAAAAISFCSGVTDHQQVKAKLLDCSTKEIDLETKILDGNILNFNLNCIVPLEEQEKVSPIEVSIYPNPATDELSFVVPANSDLLEISIMDISGKRIFYTQEKNITRGSRFNLPISKLKAGLYFLNIRQNQYFWTDKFIKL